MDDKLKLKYLNFNRTVHKLYNIYNGYFRSFFGKSISFTNGESTNPFFIVGSGRSGNTLLRRILNAQSGIVIPPETYVLGEIFRLHYSHRSVEWEQYVNIMLSTFDYHDQFYTFEIDSLRDLGLRLKRLDTKERSLAKIVDSFYRFYAERKEVELERWGDKTPINAAYVYQLKKLFPHAQFIHIIRDGVDVTYSYVQAGIYDEYEAAAIRWKKAIQFLQKFGHDFTESYLEITYEDLVRNPRDTVKEVCKFLNINFIDEMIRSKSDVEKLGDVKYLDHHTNVFNEINTDSIGKGRSHMSATELLLVKEILNPLLAELNYQRLTI